MPAILTPLGAVTLFQAAAFRPTDRLMPPNTFDASHVDLATNLCRDPTYGFYPVELGGTFTGKLALKFCKPCSRQEGLVGNYRTEAQWYGWCDSRRIGVAYYGTCEFAVKGRKRPQRGILLERFVDPVLLSTAETNFSPDSNDAQRIKARWNERSLADWVRIKGVLLAGGLLPCDLQLLLEETGRLAVIDPEMFEMAPHIKPNDSFAQEQINDIAKLLSQLVSIPRY